MNPEYVDLLEERRNDAFFLLSEPLREKKVENLTRQEIIDLYEALYVDAIESLANTEDAFQDADSERKVLAMRKERLQDELDQARMEANRWYRRFEALVNLVVQTDEEMEDLIL